MEFFLAYNEKLIVSHGHYSNITNVPISLPCILPTFQLNCVGQVPIILPLDLCSCLMLVSCIWQGSFCVCPFYSDSLHSVGYPLVLPIFTNVNAILKKQNINNSHQPNCHRREDHYHLLVRIWWKKVTLCENNFPLPTCMYECIIHRMSDLVISLSSEIPWEDMLALRASHREQALCHSDSGKSLLPCTSQFSHHHPN